LVPNSDAKKRYQEASPGTSNSGPGQKKIGLYLPVAVVEELKAVGDDLQNRAFSGTLSDVVRLVLFVTKQQGVLDARKLLAIAADIERLHVSKP
jgi:hypothetical protein